LLFRRCAVWTVHQLPPCFARTVRASHFALQPAHYLTSPCILHFLHHRCEDLHAQKHSQRTTVLSFRTCTVCDRSRYLCVIACRLSMRLTHGVCLSYQVSSSPPSLLILESASRSLPSSSSNRYQDFPPSPSFPLPPRIARVTAWSAEVAPDCASVLVARLHLRQPPAAALSATARCSVTVVRCRRRSVTVVSCAASRGAACMGLSGLLDTSELQGCSFLI